MKLGYCVIALHLVANIAGAFPIGGKSPIEGSPVVHRKNVENCTNFSGDFQGTCIVEDKTITKSAHIEQSGCELLTVDGDSFKIGTLVTKATSDPASVETDRFDWDKDQKSLLFTGAWIVGSGDALSLRGQVTLEGGKLTEVLKTVGPTVKDYGTCRLTRQ